MSVSESAKAVNNSHLEPVSQAPTRRWWQHAIASGSHHSGLLRIAQYVARSWDWDPNENLAPRKSVRPKLAILCYHRVGTGGVPLYSALPPAVFEAQMRYLRRRYRLLSLLEICEELARPRTLEPGVAVTFDDGYADTFHEAFPILQKWGIPATVFLAVGAIEAGEAPWYDRIFVVLATLPDVMLQLELDVSRVFRLGSPLDRIRVAGEIVRILRSLPEPQRQRCVAELEAKMIIPSTALRDRMLSWRQIQTMQRGGISFGSHTVSHRVIAQLPTADVLHELTESKRIMESRLGVSA